jgi:sugar-specific transcriptional regulator TrmB
VGGLPFLEKAVTILNDLGLTIMQSKAYMALAKSHLLTVAEISNLSKIQRTDLYSVLKDLEEKGLVEREISHPIRYRAIPFQQGLDLLLKKKDEKHIELQKKVADLRHTIGKLQKRRPTIKSESRFIIVPRNRVINRIEKTLENTHKSVDLILSQLQFSKGFVLFFDKMEKSYSRKVTWRFIIEKPDGGRPFWDQIAYLKAKPSCQVKFLTTSPQTILGIYDQKEVFVFETPTENIDGSPALWSNNKSLVSIISDYFDILWLTALEIWSSEAENKPMCP